MLGVQFGLGGASHGVKAEEYRPLFESFAAIADGIATVVGPEVAAAIEERVGTSKQGKATGLTSDFTWSAEQGFSFIFDQILGFAAETGDLMGVLLDERVGELTGTVEEMMGQVTRAITELSMLPGLVKQFEFLGLSLGETEEQAYRSALAISDLAGGIEALMAKQEFYYQNFFSETERLQKSYDDARGVIVSLNGALGLSGEALIDTRKELRDYIESLDLTTEAGQQAYNTALDLAPAIVAADTAMEQLTSTAEDAADATAVLETNLDAMTSSLRDSVASIIEMQQSISETLGSTSENILLRMMEDEEKYNYYKGQIDAEVARLPGLTDPAEIEASINRINSLSQAASGLLDTEQLLNGMGQEWIDFLGEVQGLATGRLEDIKGQQEDSLTKLETGSQKIYDAGTQLVDSGNRISEASNVFLVAAGLIRDAAANMPSRIVVEVREKTSEVA
jgi:hypothetical protein